jgi:hypothetical protein
VSGTNLFSFITRDGAEGLLQISKVKDNPREIRVRYKLARPASPQRSKSTNSTRR